jgi:hypothetical protein
MTRKTPYRTEPDPELERLVEATPPGMAHWAGTGPAGTTCVECRSYGYDPELGGIVGLVHPHSCRRLFQMTGRPGPAFSPWTPSCKHFQPLGFARLAGERHVQARGRR